jgi:hypothetical protein
VSENIVEKIKKLLALSKSTNIHEAASAAEKAHKLMLEHRLAISDVTDVLPEDIVEEEIMDARMMAVWRFGLLTACARNYYCGVVRLEDEILSDGIATGMRITAVIMGRKDDVGAVRCLFEHMEKEATRLCEEKFEAGRVPGTPVRLSDIQREESWKRGAAVAIQEKLQGQRVMFEREDDKAMKMGDKAREAVDLYRSRKFPDTYKPRMYDRTDHGAFAAGYRTGLDLTVPREDQPRMPEPNEEKTP